MAEPEKTVAPVAPPPAPEPAWRAPTAGVASALVLFCAAMAIMMLVRYTQERSADPLNDKTLIGLRTKFIAHPNDEATKEAIRQKDLAVRREYFAIQWHLNTGAWMLVPAASVLLILLNLLVITRAPAPDPESLAGPTGEWRAADRRRRAVAAFALAVFALTAVAAMVLARGSVSLNEDAKANGIQKVGR
jgi:hypothetical protein